jgi:aspartyl-tRNA(Asn)/glutamyl-tRNA(Gln) amidotransferase subunit A
MAPHAELANMPATEIASRIRSSDLSPVEVVEGFLERIEAGNKEVNAYILVLDEDARRRATDAEKAIATGAKVGPLHGVPIAIKDLFDFKAGVPNTFGCKPFKDWTPTVSATYVTRLEQAGAIVLGKTNTPEFGHRGITDNYLFGPTSTPFRIGKNAGGSSGGSAAAVAAGLAPIAQGSDGGGSIRIPAAWCGVYGFKASFGRVAAVARPDAFMLAVPFAHAGPLARSVADAALMLGVMAGPDDRDPYSLPADQADYMAATRRSVGGLRIAWSPDLGVFPIDPEVARVTREAVAAFELAGARVEEVRVGLRRSQEELCDCWMRQSAVRSAQTADAFKEQGFDLLGSLRDEISPEFAASLELGHKQSALDYRRDDVIRTEVLDALQDVFDRYDLLVCPTLAALPVDNAANGNTLGPTEIAGRRVDPLLGWCLTYPFNFTGHPAASIPAGLSRDGLPVGLQIAGRRFADETVIAASAAFEQARPWAAAYAQIQKAANR